MEVQSGGRSCVLTPSSCCFATSFTVRFHSHIGFTIRVISSLAGKSAVNTLKVTIVWESIVLIDLLFVHNMQQARHQIPELHGPKVPCRCQLYTKVQSLTELTEVCGQ